MDEIEIIINKNDPNFQNKSLILTKYKGKLYF